MTSHLESTGVSRPPSTSNGIDMPKAPHADALAAAVRQVLRREFTTFFDNMMKEEPNWPRVADNEFIDAIADSLIDMGKRSNRGTALLQTLIIELQDRLNKNLQG